MTMRILWLTFERVPHPDAVCYPASADDARFVLALLSLPYAERLRLTEQLRQWLHEQMLVSVFERAAIPCRQPSGLYHLVQWRLAKWLSCVLPAADGVLEQKSQQIRRWLESAKCGEPAGSERISEKNLESVRGDGSGW